MTNKHRVFNRFGIVLSWINDRPVGYRNRVENVDEMVSWDRATRRKLGCFAGLRFFRRDSEGHLILVSRHWPHLLTWQWSVSVGIKKRGMSRRLRIQVGYRRSLFSLFGPFIAVNRQGDGWITAKKESVAGARPTVAWNSGEGQRA